VIPFDLRLDVSPFALFRALVEGRRPLLVDVRLAPGASSFAGAVPWPGAGWSPPDADVVFFDDGGTLAREAARRLQDQGFPRARALYGGLALYDFALDPAVVGEERFLLRQA
jgi:rhodanese-related sulfurtransferase